MNNIIRPRRLLVSGGSRLSENAACLWRELGSLLAMEDGLVIITGGLHYLADEPNVPTADYSIVEGMINGLESRGVPLEKHIETFLPDVDKDFKKLIRFNKGLIRILNKRNPQSRRFSMVHMSDVVVSIEGEHGTRSVLDVALAIERPILPLPFGNGASRDFWNTYREDIISWFNIKPDEVERFEQTNLAELDQSEITNLAKIVSAFIKRGLTQGCFVIMPFHEDNDPIYNEVIQPALSAHGYQSWRTDHSVPYGDIIEAIRDGINHCSFAIAVTTGDRPNVMYELGMAHAANKPVILLRHVYSDGFMPPLPFDVQSHIILKYTDDMYDLRQKLGHTIMMMKVE